MATQPGNNCQNCTETETEQQTTSTTASTVAPLILRLSANPGTSTTPNVTWSENTVDNENLNRKKSKCCCIFKKTKRWDESSSDSDEDETEHCKGHVEKKKENSHKYCDGFCAN
uniref:Protein phosphatase 1 regulatory subunit 11 n=1 Tax=Rhabditophanes sp. KR3021 TaxID=114890 RepID=A0AC35UAJ9_9BILA